MSRGPRYVPRAYTYGGQTHWRVYDTQMQVPHADQYTSLGKCKASCRTRNEAHRRAQQDRDKGQA